MDRKEALRKLAILPVAGLAGAATNGRRDADPDVPFNTRENGERMLDASAAPRPQPSIVIRYADTGRKVYKVRVANWDAPWLERWETDADGEVADSGTLVRDDRAFTVELDGRVYRSADPA